MIWLSLVKFYGDIKFQTFPAAGHPKNIDAVQTIEGVINIDRMTDTLLIVGFTAVCLENHELVCKHTDMYRKKASIM